jgi:glutaredoxin
MIWGRKQQGGPAVPNAHDARVVVYTRQGCHLCEVALEAVEQVCASTGDSWTSVDVDANPDLAQRFSEQVPVTFVDGAQHDFWSVDPTRLVRALGRRRRGVT